MIREISAVMDLSTLLSAVNADSPCGEDLEYDSAFLELERAAQGQPERQMGDAVLAAEPPEWRSIREQAKQLLSRSKDLRISYYWSLSQIALEGLSGFAHSLEITQTLLEQYWQQLYPLLDADDDNDPTVRVNALSSLSSDLVIRLLRDSDLVRSRAFGPISVKAALNAAGLVSFANETLNAEQLSAAFRDCDSEQLQTLRNTLSDCQTRISAIQALIAEQIGAARGVDFQPLSQTIKQIQLILAEHAPYSQSVEAEAQDSAEASDNANPSHGASAPRISGEVRSREDVLRALDRIIEYYQRQEPSSPLPVLLNRARGLVEADFASIVRNLIPDGFSQFENLRGPDA